MFEQVIAAPFALLKRPGLYLLALILILIQGVLAIVFGDYLGYFSISLAALDFQPTLEFFAGMIIFILSTSIPIYLHATISHSIHEPKTRSLVPMGILGSSLILGIVAGVIGLAVLGIGLFMSGVIGITGGFVSLIGVILFLILGLILFFAILKFMFAPTFIGKGFPVKDALAESWKITTGKLLQTIGIALLLAVVGIFIGSIPTILPLDLTNEWMNLIVSSLFAALTGSYSAVLLALIAGKDTNTPKLGPRHAHKK